MKASSGTVTGYLIGLSGEFKGGSFSAEIQWSVDVDEFGIDKIINLEDGSDITEEYRNDRGAFDLAYQDYQDSDGYDPDDWKD